MKILDVEPIPLQMPLERVFTGGTYQVKHRNTIVVRITTDEGLVGETYGGDEDLYQEQVVSVIRDHFRPLLVGRDPFMVEELNQQMCSMFIDLGHRGLHALDMARHAIQMQAVSAVDVALWDLLGKATGQPLYKLLGGFRTELPVISIGGYYSPDGSLEPLVAEVELCKRVGVAGIKMKVGRASLKVDLERVRTVREAGGPDFLIACDANQGWTVRDAIQFAREVEPLDIAWLEEPVVWYDCVEGLRRVREATRIPVCSGQGEVSRQGVRDLVMRGSVDIINADVTMMGGVTQWRKMCGMAECFDVTLGHHEEPQVAAHLLASVPDHTFVECFDEERDPFFWNLANLADRIKDRRYHVPTGPGFGIEFDWDYVRRHTVERRVSP